MRKKLTLISIVLLLIVFSLGGIFLLLFQNKFPEKISSCNSEKTELRFSCYRKEIGDFYKNNEGVKEFIARVEKERRKLSFESKDNSYAIFGTNCHTFYHAFGDFVAVHAKNEDVIKLLNSGPKTCTSGYLMGLLKRRALQEGYSESFLKKLYSNCRKEEKNQCAHEIGHLLHDKYTVSILLTLDNISKENYGFEYPEIYRYQTFEKADLNEPFNECKRIIADENKLAQCYTGIGHNLFLFSEFSPRGFKDQFEACKKGANEENLENCYNFLLYRIGINDGATKVLSFDFKGAKKLCEESVALITREELIDHCFLGVGGGIGLFVDSGYATVTITEENAIKIKGKLTEYMELCEALEKEAGAEAEANCFHGLLGTRFRFMYEALNLYNENIERILPTLKSDFQVVG